VRRVARDSGTVLAIPFKLVDDIEACVERFRQEPAKWGRAPKVFEVDARKLRNALPKLLPNLPPYAREALTNRSFAALQDNGLWADIESIALQVFPTRFVSKNPVIMGLRVLAPVYFDNASVVPPGYVKARDGDVILQYDLYAISPKLLLDFKSAMEKLWGQSDFAALTCKNHQTHAIAVLLKCAEDEQCKRWLAAEGLDAFGHHEALVSRMHGLAFWAMPRMLIRVLGEHDPARWGSKTIALGDHVVDLTALYELSEKVFDDLCEFARKLPPEKHTRESRGSPRYLTHIQHDLPSILALLEDDDASYVKSHGLYSLAVNGHRLLKVLLQAKVSPSLREAILLLKLVVDTNWPEHQVPTKDLLPFQILLDRTTTTRPHYFDGSYFHSLSPRFYDDVVLVIERVKGDMNSEYSPVTISTRVGSLHATLQLVESHTLQEFGRDLVAHGLSAFSIAGGKWQKEVFRRLQEKVRNGTIGVTTGKGYRQGLKWFLDQADIRVVKAYPIRSGKTDEHLRRLNADDYYSAEQCRELAYHVESLLADDSITPQQRIHLMLARVLLKTGWNLATTLGIECEDIVRLPTALNPVGSYAVVLQKARAGYRCDKYEFSNESTSVRSAVLDLLTVRDELTAAWRDALPSENPFRSYVFIIESKGAIERIAPAAPVSAINNLLRARDCSLTFNTMRIRKGGMNHLYRQVQKNLRAYEQTAKHTAAVFESSYYRVDENQARYTLGTAVEVMGRYFSGKEISSEIVIVTDPSHCQHTPSGECASVGNDTEAARYGVEHKRLLAEREQSSRFCADFLSCIWCKFFRLVADAEHVWRLLSYRDYVLATMEASAVDGDATEDQQVHVGMLRDRVNEMLARLDVISAGVSAKGEALLADRGMHPDWQFALPQ
jgi:hypothetical protein